MRINDGEHGNGRIENPRVGGSIPPQATTTIHGTSNERRLAFGA
jgi:hypothetical protein